MDTEAVGVSMVVEGDGEIAVVVLGEDAVGVEGGETKWMD